jgi:hypothetical protein
MFLGLPDPHPDPLTVSHKYGSGYGSGYGKSSKENLDFYCFVTILLLFLSLKNDVNVPIFRIHRIRMFLGLPVQHPDPLVRGTDPRIRISVPKCHESPTQD